MNKVYITPRWLNPDKAEGGMRRVTTALAQYLPAHGWEAVGSPLEADLINSHGGDIVEGCEHQPVVQSNHGLMWEEYFGHAWDDVNRRCVAAMKRADYVTFPSDWVRRAVTRGVVLESQAVYHGVEWQDFEPSSKPERYALWNKARSDAVSDHREVEKLAAMAPDLKFVSTLGERAANLDICGVVPYGQMQSIVRNAGVYLALPRETFGIGTLEAMAAGVPIAGWDYGGQAEIVKQGETGYLAPYGDWEALAECVRACLKERKRLGRNARADVKARWTWDARVAEYAAIFDRVLEAARNPLKVSVILTCFNLGRYLEPALQSVVSQEGVSWECVIVDDCSSDNTAEIAQAWAAKDVRFKYHRPPRNLGLPDARNYGFAHASGRYALLLDADDLLAPHALLKLSAALDTDKSAHVVYGGLDVMNADASQQRASGWEPGEFDWKGQVTHHNQLHYGAMMRRSVYTRTGGYRHRSWQAEDAEFWCVASSRGVGFKRATRDVTHHYRMRPDSKTHTDRPMGTQWSNGDWAAWTPYAKAPQATPFGAPAVGSQFWPVPHHETPLVSVVIPVGPGHETVLQDALDSLLAQTMPDWEVIVVNDTRLASLDSRGYDFVRWLQSGAERPRGAGAARNAGAKAARGQYVVFLDADDFLQPKFLEETVAVAKHYPDALVYSDWYQENGTGDSKVWQAADFDCKQILQQMIYNVTVLHPRAAWEKVGGFDETLMGWEDWDYFIKLARAGVCAVHIPQPLMTYRYHTGARREESYANKPALLETIGQRYAAERAGEAEMACGGCGGTRVAAPTPPSVKVLAEPSADMVLMEYAGTEPNTHRIVGKVTGAVYRFGGSSEHRTKYVYGADVPALEALRKYHRVVQLNAATLAAPSPLVVRERPEPQGAKA